MDVVETRALFSSGDLAVTVDMIADPDARPDNEFDPGDGPEAQAAAEAYMRRWQAGDWQYVGMRARVTWRGNPIGEDSLWAIEHGTVREGVNADAWEMTPAQYPNPGTVVMASPLSGVLCAALDDAHKYLEDSGWWDESNPAGNPVVPAMVAAHKWADPNGDHDLRTLVTSFTVHALGTDIEIYAKGDPDYVRRGTGKTSGFVLVWGDGVANAWDESYPSLSLVMARLAVLLRCGEEGWEAGFAHDPAEFIPLASSFLTSNLQGGTVDDAAQDPAHKDN